MILKFWPWWPWKWPLNLNSLGGCLMDFILNYIFEISGFHLSKRNVECAIYSILILKSPQARGDKETVRLKKETWLLIPFFHLFITVILENHEMYKIETFKNRRHNICASSEWIQTVANFCSTCLSRFVL